MVAMTQQLDPDILDSMNESDLAFPKSLDIAQTGIYGLSVLSAGLFLFFPLMSLLNPSPWQRGIGTAHGVAAMGSLVVMAYTGHLAFPLLRGSVKVLPHVRTLTFWSSLLSFLAIATGNLAYMRYRAGAEFGGARAWLRENSPLTHYVIMEYHEFSVLFTLPFAVTAAWVFWVYGNSILEKRHRPVLTAACLSLMAIMFFAIGGMVTGLGIAKIHAL
jgi:hypothetical protein